MLIFAPNKGKNMAQNKTWADESRKIHLAEWFVLHSDENIEYKVNHIASEINKERSTASDYSGRILLEFLQNVDDAANKSNESTPKHAKFILDGRVLKILNQGKPFNVNGMNSVYHGHLSFKNPDDPGTTGSKGIGFRGTLNWSKKIQIYSGDFAVLFSLTEARKAVEQYKNSEIYQKSAKNNPDWLSLIPILKSPFNIDFPPEWENGKYKYDGVYYDTCIEILLEDEMVESYRSEVFKFIQDEYKSILFFLNIHDLSFVDKTEGCEFETRITLNKEPRGTVNGLNYSFATIMQTNDDGTSMEQSFHVFDHETETIAIPVDWEKAKDETYFLYATFPAYKENCPFPVLMNSSALKLNSNRNSLKTPCETNQAVLQKLSKMLVTKIAPYFARPELNNMALGMVRYSKQTVFDDFVDDIDDDIAKQPIIQTYNNEYKCLNQGLKTIPFADCPEFIVKYSDTNFIKSDVCNMLSFSSKLNAKVRNILNTELYNIVNEQSEQWSREQRIQTLLFWLREFFWRQKTAELLPKLIKLSNGTFYTFDSSDHDIPFLYSGVKLTCVPDWLDFNIIDTDEQNEFFKQFKETQIEPNLTETKIERIIHRNYESLFNYMDKSEMAKRINSGINNHFNRAKDLIKFIYYNYKSDSEDFNAPENAKITWHVPTAHGTVSTPENVCFGIAYDDGIPAKICEAAGLAPFPSIDEFDIMPTEQNSFKITIKNFCKIRDNILLQNTVVSNVALKSDILAKLKKQNTEYEIYGINTITGAYIPELKTLLQNAHQDLILEWLDRYIISELSTEADLLVDFSRKHKPSDTCRIKFQQPIIYELMHEKWLDFDGEKISPLYCLAPTTKNKQSKYITELVHLVPNGLKYKNIWDVLGVAQNIYQLPDDAFYTIMLKLPDIDPNGELSIRIYREIAYVPEEQTGDLNHLSESNCPEKIAFFKNGKLWAKNKSNPDFSYYPINQQVYFSNKKVLNFGDKPILATPLRTGNINKFQDILNVAEYHEDITADYNACTKHPDNEAFCKYFDALKPYLYALKTTEQLHNAIPNMVITLVDSVKLIDQNLSNDNIENYYPINAKENRFCIYLDKNATLDNIEIANTIGEICDLVSNSSRDISDSVTLLYMYPDHERRIKWLIEKGCDVSMLAEYKNVKQHFIDIVKSMSSDEALDEMINEIDFDNLSSNSSLAHIRNIINTLGTDVDTFAARGFHYINFKPANKRKLDNYINANLSNYQGYLYNVLYDKPVEEQEKFVLELDKFEKAAYNLPEISNSHNFNPADVLPIPEYENKHQFSKDILDKNYKKLNAICPDKDILEELLNNHSNMSLLYFGQIDILKNRYDELIAHNAANQSCDTSGQDVKRDILEIELYTPSNNTNQTDIKQSLTRHTKSIHGKRQHNKKIDIQKQKRGLEAEWAAYDKLVSLYGPENVRWVSGNAAKAGVIIGSGDDTLGYDMTYTDIDGNVQFIEVKSATDIGDNKYSFILTSNEEQTARENLDSYYIFLVMDKKIKKILANDLINDLLRSAKIEQKICFVNDASQTIAVNAEETYDIVDK